jgi:hypothetical protein
VVGGVTSFGSAAVVVTVKGALNADQLPAASRALAVNVYVVDG